MNQNCQNIAATMGWSICSSNFVSTGNTRRVTSTSDGSAVKRARKRTAPSLRAKVGSRADGTRGMVIWPKDLVPAGGLASLKVLYRCFKFMEGDRVNVKVAERSVYKCVKSWSRQLRIFIVPN